MACKLVCPDCLLVCKEEGDESKEAQGEYRVYNAPSKNTNILKCLECGCMDEADEWLDEVTRDVQVTMEISARTGWTHPGSWKFWLIQFTPVEMLKLKQALPHAKVISLERKIWNKLSKSEWTNFYSEPLPNSDNDGMLLGLTLKIKD
jgi:hypothetical protein